MKYPTPTVNRALRALRCSPFHMSLFAAMRSRSVSILEIAGPSGVKHQYTQSPLLELAAEDALLWLIQVGVLRREVDGQGLTDSFRLTPLGQQLVEQWQQQQGWSAPSLPDRLQDAMSRWLRFSP